MRISEALRRLLRATLAARGDRNLTVTSIGLHRFETSGTKTIMRRVSRDTGRTATVPRYRFGPGGAVVARASEPGSA